ncbi:MAG: PilZ domain-containing protein [Acidobacteria bacterium]|nr:PilZ domain-containing protein [Acidobacteriota bacterium]
MATVPKSPTLLGGGKINATLHVCDETREAQVCEKAHLLDTARMPYHLLVRHLSEISQGGVWLKPFRGLIPRTPGFPEVAILLLSEKLEVVECIVGHPENGISEVDPRVASALIVPARAVEFCGVQSGDRMRICDAESRAEWDCRNDEPRLRGNSCRCFMSGPEHNENEVRAVLMKEAVSALDDAEKREEIAAEAPKKRTWRERLSLWLSGYSETERRSKPRSRFPEVVAYYWTGGTPKAYRLGDIGPAGFYLLTSDRWTLGTRLIVTFQYVNADAESADSAITMPATVIRTGSDGVGFAFVQFAAVDPKTHALVPADDQSRERLRRFLERAVSSSKG